VKIEVFTVEEANRLVAEIRHDLGRLVEAKREYDRVQTRADVLRLAAAGTSPGNPDAVELAALEQRRAQLADRIARGVAAIHRRGGLVKDLDMGLVDFYALAGDRLVLLCWKLDEAEILHWHTVEGGFANRQPLKRAELE
jgi:hypothetical protein